jgi:hypothetical protein
VIGRHTAFEGDALGLGADVAVAVFGEARALLLAQRGPQVGGVDDRARPAVLADTRLDSGSTKTWPWRRIRSAIWPSPASGPRTAALGTSTCRSSGAP